MSCGASLALHSALQPYARIQTTSSACLRDFWISFSEITTCEWSVQSEKHLPCHRADASSWVCLRPLDPGLHVIHLHSTAVRWIISENLLHGGHNPKGEFRHAWGLMCASGNFFTLNSAFLSWDSKYFWNCPQFATWNGSLPLQQGIQSLLGLTYLRRGLLNAFLHFVMVEFSLFFPPSPFPLRKTQCMVLKGRKFIETLGYFCHYRKTVWPGRQVFFWIASLSWSFANKH